MRYDLLTTLRHGVDIAQVHLEEQGVKLRPRPRYVCNGTPAVVVLSCLFFRKWGGLATLVLCHEHAIYAKWRYTDTWGSPGMFNRRLLIHTGAPFAIPSKWIDFCSLFWKKLIESLHNFTEQYGLQRRSR